MHTSIELWQLIQNGVEPPLTTVSVTCCSTGRIGWVPRPVGVTPDETRIRQFRQSRLARRPLQHVQHREPAVSYDAEHADRWHQTDTSVALADAV